LERWIKYCIVNDVQQNSFNLISCKSDEELLEQHIDKFSTQELVKLCEESSDNDVEKKKLRTWKLMELLMGEPHAERSHVKGRRLA
jgi:hypothetical protein